MFMLIVTTANTSATIIFSQFYRLVRLAARLRPDIHRKQEDHQKNMRGAHVCGIVAIILVRSSYIVFFWLFSCMRLRCAVLQTALKIYFAGCGWCALCCAICLIFLSIFHRSFLTHHLRFVQGLVALILFVMIGLAVDHIFGKGVRDTSLYVPADDEASASNGGEVCVFVLGICALVCAKLSAPPLCW